MATTKNEENKVKVPLEGVKAKLQTARVMLQDMNLNKTGKNDFAHFDFFQLEDFLPKVNSIFVKLGLYSEFTIAPVTIDYEETTSYNASGNMISVTKKPIIKEMATLVITDILKPEDQAIYEMEVAPVVIGNNTKQNIYQAAGGRNTYYKRYLYMNALEIVEKDESDAVLGQEGVNYTQPQMTPYDFMPKQQSQPVMREVPQNEYAGAVANNLSMPDNNIDKGDWEPQQLNQVANTLEQTTTKIANEQEPLSVESKFEIMGLVNQKGLDGSSILSEFCRKNGVSSPNDLLELHKQPLIDMINNIK